MNYNALCLLLLMCVGAVTYAELVFDEADATALRTALLGVREDTSTSQILGRLSCRDTDTTSLAGITIKVTNGGGLINGTPTARPLQFYRLARKLDFENVGDQNERDILIECEKANLISAKFQENVVILDVNDNSPFFEREGRENDTYNVAINEVLDVPSGGLLIYSDVKVRDIDGVNNNLIDIICVDLTSTPPVGELRCEDYFRLQPVDLQDTERIGRTYRVDLYAMRSDYSAFTAFAMRILAENVPIGENTTEPTLNSTTQNFEISINEVQNEPPQIIQNTLRLEMFEDLAVGSAVKPGHKIIAFDQDTRSPNPIEFELLPAAQDPTGFNFFELGPSVKAVDSNNYEVELRLKNAIDREKIIDVSKNVYVDIRAYETNPNNLPDRNPMNSTATITVNVKDVNDIIPTFSSNVYSVSAFERSDLDFGKTQLNPSSGSIRVTDFDGEGFNSFNLSVVPGPFSDLFELDPTGSSVEQIFTLYINNSALDFEQDPNMIDVTLRAVDTNRTDFTSTALVQLTILPRNEFSPVFPPEGYTFNVSEDTPVGTTIGEVSATDADRGAFGEIASYEIQDPSNTFDITNDGKIFTLKPLDFETVNFYGFSVTARDNDIPQDAKEDTVQVNCFILNLIDNPPRFIDDYITQVNEESLNLQPQITVQAETVEPNTFVTFSLQEVLPPGINITEFFSIGPQNGIFTLIKPLDHRDTDDGLIRVLVRASISPTLYSEKYINITVINLNNAAPVFVPSSPDDTYYVSLKENAPGGFVVIDLNTTDADEPNTPNSEVEFDIKTGANNVFIIDQDSGIITVVNGVSLDIDLESSYTIVVVAKDKGNPVKSSSATVSITLLDANNKPPVFETPFYRFRVNDSITVGDFVGQVSATDVDMNPVIRYSLEAGSGSFQLNSNNVPGNVADILTIESTTGIIRLAGELSSSYDRISFNVIAEDIGIESGDPRQFATANVLIFILTAPDSRILFDLPWTYDNPVISDSFSESLRTNKTILTLRATDPVKAEAISIFRKIPSSDPENYFVVTGGKIELREIVDYEALPVTENGRKILSLEVEAISNDYERTGTATVRLQVTDFNDNRPEFERREYVVPLEENSDYPTEVARLRVTDRDSSSFGIAEFSISGLDGPLDDFFVEEDPNEVNVAIIRVGLNANLDFESNRTIIIFVTAQDDRGSTSGLTDTVTLRINLIDVNDNPPVFRDKVYTFEVIAGAKPGDVVGQVIADDADTGRNGDIQYTIEPGSSGAFYFNADKDDETAINTGLQIGEILVARSLESLPYGTIFNITVRATDNGLQGQLSGTAIALISVSTDGQDPKPQWDANLPTRVQIPENRPIGTCVATITANASSSVEYSFITTGENTSDASKFAINAITGRICTNAVLDYEQQKFLNLRILATVVLNTTLTNQYLLIVDVLDVDDNEPTFQRCTDRTYPIPVVTQVMEARPAQEFVYTVIACDDDEAPNNNITYRSYTPQPDSDLSAFCQNQSQLFGSTFELNPITGVILTRVSLDRDTISEYTLCIQAEKGSAGRRKRGTADNDLEHNVLVLRVIVLDANDNGPQFTERLVKTVILPNRLGDISVAEATDIDIYPNNQIGYSIESIEYSKQNTPKIAQPHTFVISRTDGSISTSISDYSSFTGGSFEIVVKAEDLNRQNDFIDLQTQTVYVADPNDVIRVVINRPADSGVEADVNEMIERLNVIQEGVFYEVTKISYHVINNEEDPRFDKTDVCLVVVQDDAILNSQQSISFLEDQNAVNSILSQYGATDPGPCDPAKSVYPQGWESYWWVLVAFAIFVFVCVLILIFIILSLYSSYKRYMDTRRTYLVPGN